MVHAWSENDLQYFKGKMLQDEKATVTIEKYMRDIRAFFRYIGYRREIGKEQVLDYKKHIISKYAPASVNSMLAALNCFFREMEWYDCTVKCLKIQRDSFRSQEQELSKGEYYRLLDAAKRKGDHRLNLLMQTICATGIRVSELRFITTEAIKNGYARVGLKGKTRTVLLPDKLCRKLKKYAGERQIQKGCIFITKSGRPMDRSNIFHGMKKLCDEAGVSSKKVFPHNLRHLFACTFYRLKKDLSRLADILGHSNINTTRIYTQISGREQLRQIEQLDLVV